MFDEDKSGSFIETRKIQFQNQVDFFRHPTVYESLINAGNTTPSVDNIDLLILSGVATIIINFTKGYNNQYLRVLGDGVSTISNNVNIKTNTGANKILAIRKIYRFTYYNKVWYEDA